MFCRPSFAGRNSLGADFDEDEIGGDVFWIGFGGWSEVLIAGEEDGWRDDFTIEGEVVNCAIEGVGGGASIAGADDDVIGIRDGCRGGGAAHVPRAFFDFEAVDEGDNAFRFPKGVA